MAHGAAKIRDRDKALQYILDIEQQEYDMYGLPQPDLVIVFDVDPNVAQANVYKKAGRQYIDVGLRDIAEDDHEHQSSAAEWYLWLCEVRDNYVRVDCMDEEGQVQLPPDVIEARIWLAVQENIPELVEP